MTTGRASTAVAAVSMLLLLACSLAVRAEGERETTVRAAFLFRLAFFVEWPSDAFADPAGPLRICLVQTRSAEDLARTLAEQTRGRTVQDRPLDVAVLERDDSADRCHIVYAAAGSELPETAPRCLVVVESLLQLDSSGALALVREGDSGEARLVFYGVRERIAAGDYSVSSKLLQLLRFHQPHG